MCFTFLLSSTFCNISVVTHGICAYITFCCPITSCACIEIFFFNVFHLSSTHIPFSYSVILASTCLAKSILHLSIFSLFQCFVIFFKVRYTFAITKLWSVSASAPGLARVFDTIRVSLLHQNVVDLVSITVSWSFPCVNSSFVVFELGICNHKLLLIAKFNQRSPSVVSLTKSIFTNAFFHSHFLQ